MLAKLAVKASQTSAIESVLVLANQPGSTYAPKEAPILLTASQGYGAVFTTPAIFTYTLIVRFPIDAGAILTRLIIGLALINVQFAICALVSGGTGTSVHSNPVDTFATQTRIGHTFVNINLTIEAFVAFYATAYIACSIVVRKGLAICLTHVLR